MTNGTALIAAERARHSEEGYDAEHDRQHAGEIALAGVSYALAGADDLGALGYEANDPEDPAEHWPWHASYWKPTGDPIRDLTKAGSLIAAAIDARLEAPPAPPKLFTETVAGEKVTIRHREYGIITGILHASPTPGEFYLPLGLGYLTVNGGMFNAGWSLIDVEVVR